MKSKIMFCTMVFLLSALTGSVFGGTEGTINTFYGQGAGNSTTEDNDYDTFIGAGAGYSNFTGNFNTFVGYRAGYSNATGASNTFLGLGAGFSNTTGYNNTFLGLNAGHSNTTGYYNTFLGLGAGYYNTTGYENAFLGYQAGYSNTTGQWNTFLGPDAGYSNTEGNYNTFLGNSAGYYNTTGIYNTFLGYRAGYSNTTGYYNTFLGPGAGYSNTTGQWNTFLGPDAGHSNTTGVYNTFLGIGAGYYNTTGTWNTFLGPGAGYSNTTGSENTFLGYAAGHSNTTGEGNTLLGNYAGYFSTGNYNTILGWEAGYGNQTGSGNVFLGYWAGSSEAGSNRLYIDNSGTSTPLIYGEFDNDIVRINGRLGVLKSPGVSYQLDVNGAVNATSFTGNGSGITNLNETDPKVGTLTAGKWCSSSDGSHVSCTQTAPVTVEVDPKVGSLTAGGWCTSNGSTVNCTQATPVMVEVDPKIGSLTSGRWCTSNGSTVSCTQTAPVTTDKVGSNTLNYVPRWNGSQLVSGSLYDDGTDVTVLANLNVVAPDNGLIYLTNVTTDNTTKVSRMVLDHYSNAQLPVYLFGAASTATNNFVAFGGGNTIGNAATQLDLFTAPNTTTPVGIPRLTIIGNGYVGIGTQTPSYPLHMAGGAYSNGSSWIDVSSREYKDDIERLTSEEAFEAFQRLDPVKYAYKTDRTEKRVGFIAEEVPELVSMKDRKGLSPMDIVAVLTKVVQEQQKTISTLKEELNELKGKVR